MIYYVTMLRIYSVNVVSQLKRGWCPQNLVMATSKAMLLVRMMHE
jgi:hypothetical protein